MAWRRRWPARLSSSALRDKGFDAAMRSPQFAAQTGPANNINIRLTGGTLLPGCRWPFSPKIPALMSFRRGLFIAFLFACSVIGAQPVAAQLTEERSPGLRVIYFDGTEGYLVPHVTRTALNSLAFQKKLFGFDPQEDVSVLLLDLSDSGNAGASSVPNDLVSVQIAPLGFSFETLAANERMNTIMNHELVHVATMDQAARSDRMFRRLFGGKVLPIKEQPESILYFYLTSPRVAAPRWFHEGIAVFVDTWMAGGLGRVQSGYDEMVFRAMVRDNATFYSPLGLVSKGTDADFQLEINSYLYGARFMTWLARRYSPEQLIEWTARHEGSRAYYASQFRKVFGVSLEEAWAQWIADERTFQQANLAAIRKFPVTPYRDVTSRALGSVSRAYFDPASRKIYAAFNYPGCRRACRRDRHRLRRRAAHHAESRGR